MPEGDQPPLPDRGLPEATVLAVWELAIKVDGNDPDQWRRDEFGAWLEKSAYGDRTSEFGWEVTGDTRFGSAGLRALHWQNAVDYVRACTTSAVTAEGLHNVRRVV